MSKGQICALLVALAGVMAVGFLSSGDSTLANPVTGLIGSILAVVGWGSEAVLCAWGMRDNAVSNDTALQIRETTSAIAYALIALPLFGAWKFTAHAIPHLPTAVILLAALAGTASYLCYYKSIEVIGAARAMALNISYSAWAIIFGFVLQDAKPNVATIILCLLILVGTILAASDWNELLRAGNR
ncbi:DMT family transporter [Bifidobacterium sp. ESL0800]|nr:DMT family transporter [Bifidobacterium sp. ESL0800]WEV75644.1 DMT family transporter [Bifidobacterium sp. ESL0800]